MEVVRLSNNFMKKAIAKDNIIKTLEKMYNCKHIYTEGYNYYFRSKKKSISNEFVKITTLPNLYTDKNEEIEIFYNLAIRLDDNDLDLRVLEDGFKNYYKFDDGELDNKFLITMYNHFMK